MAKGIAEATTKIYEQLEGLAPEERRRAVDAALMMLGEPVSEARLPKSVDHKRDESDVVDFSSSAKAWIKKHNVDASALAEMFHFDDGNVKLILGAAIGKSKREQTLNTYLLTGLAAFLETGTADFADEDGRKNCQHLGCYDAANHSVYVRKDFGNKITGSKSSGWKLTAPGISAATKLIGSDPENNK